MSHGWLHQAERSNDFSLRLISWIARRLGRPIARALLYPTAAYFVLFSGAARRASRDYLGRVLNRRITLIDIFNHYHCFAATLLDRVYLLSGRSDMFDIRVHGAQALDAYVNTGRGCLLVGAHLGSFDLLRVLGAKYKLSVRVLMHQGNAEKITRMFGGLNPDIVRTVIAVGEPSTLLQAKEALDGGAMLGMLGDRVAHNDKVVTCDFLAGQAMFPSGPVLLAAALHVPVILFFGLYRGGKRYDVRFELLSERIDIPRLDREAGVAYWTQQYAARVEHYCREAPYNWFNFYNYWSDSGDDTQREAA